MADFTIDKWWGLEEADSVRLDYATRTLTQAGALEEAIEGGSPTLDRLVDAYRRQRPGLGKNDRKVLALGVFGYARNRELINEVCGDCAPGEKLIVALLDSLRDAPIIESLSSHRETLSQLAKRRDEIISLIVQNASKPLADLSNDEKNSIAKLFSIPAFWLDDNCCALGKFAREMNFAKFEQSTQLRVNTSRIPRAKAKRELEEQYGVALGETALSPFGLALAKRVDLNASKLYRGGFVEIQDEGSQLVALALEGIPDAARVLDYCAGAGGKALAVADMHPKARIVAHDSDGARLSRANERIARAKAAITLAGSLETSGLFDAVLVDAPCSSTGTLRRNPLIPWRWNKQDIENFGRIQLDILTQAKGFAKPGGLLVYSTCSLFRDENFEVVNKFLAQNKDFTLEKLGNPAFASLEGANEGMVRLRPGLEYYSGDGFFIARMRKT